MRYRFLAFELDTQQQRLSGPEGAVPLRRQSLRVLQYLIERAPAVVAKDELLDAVWGRQAISQSAVAQTVRELREALHDDASKPAAIATRHRFGYQFIAPVEILEPPPDPGVVLPTVGATTHRKWAMPIGAALLTLVIVLGLALALRAPVEGTDVDGWPRNAEARRETVAALEAARLFDVDRALASIARARRLGDTARLAILEARLRLQAADRGTADRLLAAVLAHPATLARRDRLLVEAVQAERDGRVRAAAGRYRIAHEMLPDDIDIGLALFDQDIAGNDPGAGRVAADVARLPGLPPERALLLSAQAARARAPGEQLMQADAAIAGAGERLPVLAALARVERGNALARSGRGDEARGEFVRAGDALESARLLRWAARARFAEVELAIARGATDDAARRVAGLDEQARSSDDAALLADIAYARGRLASRGGRDEEALADFREAAQRFEAVSNDAGAARALSAASAPMRRIGQDALSRSTLEEALKLSDRAADPAARGDVERHLGHQYIKQSLYEEAVKHYESAVDAYRKAGDRHGEADVLTHLWALASNRGHWRSAADYIRRALAAYRELDLRPDIARCLLALALDALDRGDLGDVETHLDEAIATLRALDTPSHLATALGVLASAKVRRADFVAAEALLDEAGALAGVEAATRAKLIGVRVEIARARGDAGVARRANAAALALLGDSGPRAQVLATRVDRARLDCDEGRLAESEQGAAEIAALAQRDAFPAVERDARIVLAAALLAQKRNADARQALAAARALLDRVPQFDAEIAWTYLEAFLDDRPRERRERLRWLIDHAVARGQHLVELEAQGALIEADPAEVDGVELARWRSEVRHLGLGRFAGTRRVILP